jgi:hypothetical protein
MNDEKFNVNLRAKADDYCLKNECAEYQRVCSRGSSFKAGAYWAREQYEAILGEERARLEEAVKVLEEIIDDTSGGIAHEVIGIVRRKAFAELARIKLKSPGERDQPTEDKSGESNAV